MPDKYSSVHSGSNVDKGVQLAVEIAEGSRIVPKAKADASGNIFTERYGANLSVTTSTGANGGITYSFRLLNLSNRDIGQTISMVDIPTQAQITTLSNTITTVNERIGTEISTLAGKTLPIVTSENAPSAITLKSLFDTYGNHPLVLIPSDGASYLIAFRSRSSGGSTWVKFTILILGTENRYSCQNEILTSSGDWNSLTLSSALASSNYEASYCRGRAIADLYSSSTSYVERDRVMYNGLLYRCIAATTGTFDPSK